MRDCVFCRIVSGDDPAEIVYADDRTLAFLPLHPAAVGHTLLVPRAHVRDLWGLSESEAHHLTSALLVLAPAIRRALSPDGLNVVNSAGAAATQTVFHLHVHLVPRWHGDSFGPLWPAPSARLPSGDERQGWAAGAIRGELGR